MKADSEVLTLTDEFFIGQGAHKKVYMHPTNKSLCIKILFSTPDVDLDRELYYRSTRQKRHLKTTMLPEYLGTINTNLGKGYVFERIYDYDGQTSATIKDFIKGSTASPEHIAHVENVITTFKELLFDEKIITSDMDPVNFLVQKTSPTQFTIRIIDNIGSPVLIPLAFFFDYLR